MKSADTNSPRRRAPDGASAGARDHPSGKRPPGRSRDNERPLVEDIRLLGRILGDVIREQDGVAAFELVEQVRKLSVAFRRDADQEADKALKKLLKSLSGEQAVSVIRAFTYFSHLANLAEDRHHIRRRAVHERAGNTQEGSIEVALARLRWAGLAPKTIANTLAHAYLSPVLTAHPTEVQRKSILDAERDIAQLLTARDEIKSRALSNSSSKDALTPRELAANEAQLRARVMQLWHTRLLRFAGLPGNPLAAASPDGAGAFFIGQKIGGTGPEPVTSGAPARAIEDLLARGDQDLGRRAAHAYVLGDRRFHLRDDVGHHGIEGKHHGRDGQHPQILGPHGSVSRG